MTPYQAALEMREKQLKSLFRDMEYGIGTLEDWQAQITALVALPLPEEPAPTGIEVTPDMLAAAWRAFQTGRQGVPFYIGSVGPGPGFKEAILAAFACASPTSPAPDVDVMGLLKAYDSVTWELGQESKATNEHPKAIAYDKARAALLASNNQLLQRAMDAEAEVRRLVDGLSALVHCQSPLTRAAMREAAAEIIARKTTTMADQSPFVATAERWKTQAQAATSVISMVRAMIGEMFGPIANIESEEATLLRGPEPRHDGEAILAALQNIQRGGPPT